MTNLILIILLAIVNTFGGTGVAEKEVARAIKDNLGTKIESVKGQIDTDPITLINKGKIEKLVFTLKRFDVKPIVIEETVITINGLKLNASDALIGKPAVIKEIGRTDWKLRIGVEQLTVAVLDKSPQIEQPFFRTVGEEIEFMGNYRLNKYMAVPFVARGRLSIQDGKRVNLLLTKFEVTGIGVPAKLRSWVEDSVNPLIDVDKLMADKRADIEEYEFALNRQLDPRIDSITVLKGKIEGKGTI
jgi:hypothetical protein